MYKEYWSKEGMEKDELNEAVKIAALLGYERLHRDSPLYSEVLSVLNTQSEYTKPLGKMRRALASNPSVQESNAASVDDMFEKIRAEVGDEAIADLAKEGQHALDSGDVEVTGKGLRNKGEQWV